MYPICVFALISMVFPHKIESNVSVTTPEGIVCPCISYYSNPDFDCFRRFLATNQTIHSTCLELVKRLYREHKFTISHSFYHCKADETVYRYEEGNNTVMTPLTHEDCLSEFEGADAFEISSSGNEFYDIVSRNSELLNPGVQENQTDVSCNLLEFSWHEVYALDICSFSNMSAILYHLNTVSGFNLHLEERFTIRQNKIRPVSYYRYEQYQPDWYKTIYGTTSVNSKEMTTKIHIMGFPGKRLRKIINVDEWFKWEITFGMAIACSWEKPFKTETVSCFNGIKHRRIPKLYAGFFYNTPTLVSFQTRISSTSVRFDFNRYNSETVQQNNHFAVAEWDLKCKLFLVNDFYYAPAVCQSCLKRGNNCEDCWNATSLVTDISPFFSLRFPRSCVFFFILLHVAKTEKSIPDNLGEDYKTCGSAFHVLQYDYFFGNSSMIPYSNKIGQNVTVLLPGNQHFPTQLSDGSKNSLSIICRVRPIFIHESKGNWSNVAQAQSHRSSFPAPLIFAFEQQGYSSITIHNISKFYIKNFYNPDFSYSLNKFADRRSRRMVECDRLYNRGRNIIFNVSTKFQYRRRDKNYCLGLYRLKFLKNPNEQLCTKTAPMLLDCATLHAFVVWTEQPDETHIIYRVMLSHQDIYTGNPLLNRTYELNPAELCSCSNTSKNVSSYSVQVVYPDLSDPTNVEIAVACGMTICLYNPYLKKSRLYFHCSDFNYKTTRMIHFTIDNDYLYFSTNNVELFIVAAPDLSPEGEKHLIYRANSSILNVKPNLGNDYTTVPEPPAYCIIPHIDMEGSQAIQSKNSTIIIFVFVEWNISAECKLFAKPRIAIKVAYGIVPSYLTIAENRRNEINCSSVSGMKCSDELPIKYVRTSRVIPPMKIFNIALDRQYLIEIQIVISGSIAMDFWLEDLQRKKSISFILMTKSRKQNATVLWLSLSLIPLALLAAALLFYCIYWKRISQFKNLQRLSARSIVKEEKIGEGNFGEVWKAHIGKETVVVKMLKESATDREEKEFREEALLLSKFQSEFIVQVLGICLQSRPIMLAMEYVNGGSLKEYLRRKEIRELLRTDSFLIIAENALLGCLYLERQGITHKLDEQFVKHEVSEFSMEWNPNVELSSACGCALSPQPHALDSSTFGFYSIENSDTSCFTNCSSNLCVIPKDTFIETLLQVSNSNQLPKHVKLSDFGLTKDTGEEAIYRSCHPESENLPIAWTAPEAFLGTFSCKSDVWAFGVLLWEIFTWAATPFGKCAADTDLHVCPLRCFSHNEIEVKVCVEKKTLLSLPYPCTAAFGEALRNILSLCWKYDACERPSFRQLKKYIDGSRAEILKDSVQKWENVSIAVDRQESRETVQMQTAYRELETQTPRSSTQGASVYQGSHCKDPKEGSEYIELLDRSG